MHSPITLVHFGELFDAALNDYVVNAIAILMGWLAPIAVTLVTIWLLMYGYATVRHETGDSIATFSGKALKIAFILAVALTQGVYTDWVVGSANALMDSLASLFTQAGGLSSAGGAASAATIWSLVDQYDARVEAIVVALGKDLLQITPPFISFPNLFAIVLISVGGCVFEVCVLVVACFAKIVLTLTLAVGPVFILTLMFTATSKFFDAWLSKLLSAIMLSGITFFLAGLSLSITGTFLVDFLDGMGTLNFIAASMVVGVIESLLGIVMIQAPTLAAALTGGAIFQSGVGTISALVAGRGWGAARGFAPAAAGGGAIQTGRTFLSAQALGRGVGAAGAGARRLAYKLAASRSRS